MAGNYEDDGHINPKRIKLADVEHESLSINDLDNDCLIAIFSFFSFDEMVNLGKVCKRWWWACQHFWKVVKGLEDKDDLCCLLDSSRHPIHYIMNTHKLPAILKNCGHFIKFYRLNTKLLTSQKVFSEKLQLGLQYCNTLQDIDIINVPSGLSQRDICLLKRHCRNLKKLALGPIENHADDELCQLLNFNENLRILRLVSKTPNTMTGKILKSLPVGIQEVHLHEYRKKTFTQCDDPLIRVVDKLKTIVVLFAHIISSEVRNAYCHLSNLRYLKKLHLCRSYGLDDFILTSIANNCKQLESLDIRDCDSLTNEGLESLANLTKLKELKISQMNLVTDEAIGNLPSSLKNFACLKCVNVRDRGVMRLLEKTPNLIELDLSDCPITNITIEKAVEVMKRRENGTTLKIYVSGTRVDVPYWRGRLPPSVKVIDNWYTTFQLR